MAGLWTVTDPPVEVHEQLIAAWEFERGPVSRWWLPVDAQAQVFEIHRPADWARLVMEQPREESLEPGDACWVLRTAEHHRPAESAPRPALAAHDFGWLGPNPSGFVFGVLEAS